MMDIDSSFFKCMSSGIEFCQMCDSKTKQGEERMMIEFIDEYDGEVTLRFCSKKCIVKYFGQAFFLVHERPKEKFDAEMNSKMNMKKCCDCEFPGLCCKDEECYSPRNFIMDSDALYWK